MLRHRCSTVNNGFLSHPAGMLARLWWAGPLLLSYLSLFMSRVGSVNPVEYWGFESTSISLWPDDVLCLPVQVTIRFTPNMTIDNRDYVVIMLPGFTSGGCDGKQGSVLVPGVLRIYPEWQWHAWFMEGTASNEWHDSRLYLQLKGTAPLGEFTPQLVILDMYNQLKLSAPVYDTSLYQIHFQPSCTTGLGALPDVCLHNSSDPIEVIPSVSGSAYVAGDEMSFFPAVLHRQLRLTLSFTPGLTLLAGDTVTIGLGGFTNGNDSSPTDQGFDVAMGDVQLDEDGGYFEAGWTEGLFESGDRPGYQNSSLDLQVKTGLTVLCGTPIKIIVSDLVGIRAHCGVGRNSVNVTIAINGTNNRVFARPFKITAPIGDGCRAQSYCNGHGRCDLCTSTCICDEGYGAPNDLIEDIIAPDCSERVCPIGQSFSGVPQLPDGPPTRTLRECSGAGYCRRDLGQCSCFEGFEGHNCGRRMCPIADNKLECSGHGRCLPMNLISRYTSAEPPSAFVGSYGSTDSVEDMAYAWDGGQNFGCMCDSTWAVGLGSGQIQLPEWYGPTCSQRRCPTGDDPNTNDIDETDCSGVTAPGGRGVGEDGNKCYVACSNRGVCDETTGLCRCFKGYYGTNCGKFSALAMAAPVAKKTS